MSIEDAAELIGWMHGVALVDWCGSWSCSVCGHNWLDVDAASLAYDLAVAVSMRVGQPAGAAS